LPEGASPSPACFVSFFDLGQGFCQHHAMARWCGMPNMENGSDDASDAPTESTRPFIDFGDFSELECLRLVLDSLWGLLGRLQGVRNDTRKEEQKQGQFCIAPPCLWGPIWGSDIFSCNRPKLVKTAKTVQKNDRHFGRKRRAPTDSSGPARRNALASCGTIWGEAG